MHAVHFGAGNIGRGFIGKSLADAGWRVTFADVAADLVATIAERRQYRVDVVGETVRRDVVRNVDAVSSLGEEVVARIAAADLVTTAVGVAVLPKIAPTLARAIALRFRNGLDAPLNVIACENAVRATSQLKTAVFANLPEDVAAWAEANVGFADSAVDRIVPPAAPDPDDPLAVTVEAFSEWIVDRTQLRGWTREVPRMVLTDDLMAFVERKLFTLNTGHAIAAYLGFRAGLATIREAIAAPAVRAVVEGAMTESGAVLIRRYGFAPDAHAAYIDKILARFANPYIVDDVARVGREPLRKLGGSDRLIRPLLGTLEYGLPHANLVRGVAAALHYRNDGDPQAVEMRAAVAAEGAEAALSRFCGGVLPAAVLAEVAAVWRESAP